MNNIPSKWYEFTNHKELKRLRMDLNDTLFLRIEIAASLVLTILTSFFSDIISKRSGLVQVAIFVLSCLCVTAILLWDYLRHKYSLWRRSGVFIKGKDASSLFDEEIVYEVLVASEYFRMEKEENVEELKDQMKNFYNIEIEYYLTSAMEKLFLLNSNLSNVLGNDGKKISIKRMDNIISLIDGIVNSGTFEIDGDVYKDYKMLCENVKKLKK